MFITVNVICFILNNKLYVQIATISVFRKNNRACFARVQIALADRILSWTGIGFQSLDGTKIRASIVNAKKSIRFGCDGYVAAEAWLEAV